MLSQIGLEGHRLFGKYLFGWDVLYYPVGILHNDTLIVQGFFLKHTFLGQLKTFVYLGL